MPSTLGSLRRLVLAPSLAAVSFAGRGFPAVPSAATERLEAVPHAVICGFEWGIEARGLWELERRLRLVEPSVCGFAYEGAIMALTVRDVMGPRRGHRTRDLLLGSGQPHLFLAYIGIGFAMARLPRALWKKVLPDLSGSPYHPTMSWLAVDGYGFDRAYFQTRRWVDEQRPLPVYPWQGCRDYFPRAVDQGIGRALWFIHGARVPDVATAVAKFAGPRHADLWSGVALAAAFAGGCGRDGLTELRAAAGEHWAEAALGVVFAVKARAYADFVPPHTELAAAVLAGLSVEAAVALADRTAVDPRGDLAGDSGGDSGGGSDGDPGVPGGAEEVPPYELWRHAIRSSFASSTATVHPEADAPGAQA